MKPLLLFCLLLSVGSFAQTDTLYKYFTDLDKETSPENAIYNAVAIRTENFWTRFDFYSDIGVLKQKGYYTDDKLKKKEGPFIGYHRNSKIAFKGSYYADKKNGRWYMWNEEGKLTDSMLYKTGIIQWQKSYNEDGQLTLTIEENEKGEMISRGFSPGSRYGHEGKLLDGKKTGSWTYTYDGGKLVVEYDEDSVMSYQCFDEAGQPVATCVYEQEAKMPKNWAQYIANASLEKSPEAYRQGKIWGTVRVQFIVNTDGKVSDAKVIYSSEPLLNETALKVIRSSPRWQPGIQFNRLVRSYRTQPLTFTRAQ